MSLYHLEKEYHNISDPDIKSELKSQIDKIYDIIRNRNIDYSKTKIN